MKTSSILLIVALGAIELFTPFTPTVDGEEPPYTLAGNLEYRWSFGDLPYATFMPGRGRSVLVTEGGPALLEACLRDPAKWVLDSDWEKLAHLHPLETVSCRERGISPNLHLRFIIPTQEFLMHFDQDGPERKWRHFGEIIRNRATFGRTHQDDIYLALVKKDPSASASLLQSLTPAFDTDETFHAYLHDAFSPEALAQTISGSAFVFAFHTIETGRTPQLSFEKALEYHAIDGGLQHSIGAATAIALRQDVRFKACSSCSTFRQRLGHALLGTLFVDGYDGHRELAFPRIASAFGSAYIEDGWLSSTRRSADPMQHAGNIFLADLAESFYVEFARTPLKRFKEKMAARIGR